MRFFPHSPSTTVLLLFLLFPALIMARKSPEEVRRELARLTDPLAKIALLTDASRELAAPAPADALGFAREALAIAQKIQNKDAVVNAYSNIGLVLMNQEKYEQAPEYLDKAIELKKQLVAKNKSYNLSIAKDYRYLGICEEKQERYEEALIYYQQGASLALVASNPEEIANAYNALGEAQLKLENYQDAHKAFMRALPMARRAEMRQFSLSIEKNITASLTLLKKYTELQQYEATIDTFRQQINSIQDSLAQEQDTRKVLVNEKQLLQMAQAEQQAKIQVQEAALKQKEAEGRNVLLGGIGGGLILTVVAIGFSIRARERKRDNIRLEKEKDRSDSLLRNIMPAKIADELKEKGKVEPVEHEEVSILFSDFKGFTSIAAVMEPEKLVSKLGHLFGLFDEIMEKYHMEKIKTIGDAYMAVAGLTEPTPHHPLNAVRAAQEMLGVLSDWNRKQTEGGEPTWELRIGIHSGPVIAGIIGEKKFAYDIWGDAVNLASRMESYGEAGKVNLSAATHERTRLWCSFEPKRTVSVKNKGEVDMYFLKEITARQI